MHLLDLLALDVDICDKQRKIVAPWRPYLHSDARPNERFFTEVGMTTDFGESALYIALRTCNKHHMTLLLTHLTAEQIVATRPCGPLHALFRQCWREECRVTMHRRFLYYGDLLKRLTKTSIGDMLKEKDSTGETAFSILLAILEAGGFISLNALLMANTDVTLNDNLTQAFREMLLSVDATQPSTVLNVLSRITFYRNQCKTDDDFVSFFGHSLALHLLRIHSLMRLPVNGLRSFLITCKQKRDPSFSLTRSTSGWHLSFEPASEEGTPPPTLPQGESSDWNLSLLFAVVQSGVAIRSELLSVSMGWKPYFRLDGGGLLLPTLKMQALLSATNTMGECLLYIALRHCHTELVNELLLSSDVHFPEETRQGNNMLHALFGGETTSKCTLLERFQLYDALMNRFSSVRIAGLLDCSNRLGFASRTPREMLSTLSDRLGLTAIKQLLKNQLWVRDTNSTFYILSTSSIETPGILSSMRDDLYNSLFVSAEWLQQLREHRPSAPNHRRYKVMLRKTPGEYLLERDGLSTLFFMEVFDEKRYALLNYLDSMLLERTGELAQLVSRCVSLSAVKSYGTYDAFLIRTEKEACPPLDVY